MRGDGDGLVERAKGVEHLQVVAAEVVGGGVDGRRVGRDIQSRAGVEEEGLG